MPAPLGPLAGFALGAVLAWLGRDASEAAAVRGLPRPVAIVALFATLIYAPVCAYFIAFAGDWSLAYLVDSRLIPSAVSLLLVILDAASVLAGFYVARRLARRRALRAIATLAAVPLAASLLFILMFFGSLRIDGTFHQVSGDFGTQPVAGGPLGYALLWMHTMLAAGLAFAAQMLRDRPRAPSISPSKPPPALGHRVGGRASSRPPPGAAEPH